MLGLQLRQRGLQVALFPGAAFVGSSGQILRESQLAFSSERDQQEPQSSAPSSTSATPVDNGAGRAVGVGPVAKQTDGATAAAHVNASEQPSQAAATALSQLRSRLAANHAAPDKRAAPAAPPRFQQSPPATTPKPVARPASQRRQEAADFQGLPLQLGEPGNPLQSMAVLTHTDVRQLEEYGKDLLASDRRFLASLQKMAAPQQQRAAAIMQMAAGAVPPPAMLVWAAQEVAAQVQMMLRERLPPAPRPPPTQQQQQQSAATAVVAAAAGSGRVAGPLVSEPWYDGALQLARIALGSSAARTERELLQAFAAGRPAAEPPPSPSQVSPPAEPYVISWEALLALPQLHSLLEVAGSRSQELAVALELAGLRASAAVGGVTPTPAAAAAAGLEVEAAEPTSTGTWLLPALRAAAAAARRKALQVTGLAATAAADAPLEADAALTALAIGAPSGAALATAAAEQRMAAADWLAAAALLRHAEERLGCAGGMSGVQREAVAVLHLLDLPLEPAELPYMDELRVSEQELQVWISQLSVQLAAGGARPDGSPFPVHPTLESRLAAARQRLAAAGRALALTSPGAAAEGPALGAAAGATKSWLRAVGAPLVSGLLSGGYSSLARLRGMVPELREALVLRLLEKGRVQNGTAALAAALYSDADAAWRAARADGAGAVTASALLHKEAVAAELDLLHERYVATSPAPPAPRPLPSDAALAAAVQALPAHARLLYDSFYLLRADGVDDAAVVQERRRVADALAAAGEGAVLQGVENLQAWMADARKGLLMLPAPLLALLLRFLRVQVVITPEEAQSQRNKLTALAILVSEQQRRAAAVAAVAAEVATAATDGGNGGEGITAAAAVAARELADWSRSDSSDGAATAATGGRVPGVLAALLGRAAAVDFTSWLQALALSSGASAHKAPAHRMLSMQHLEMDVERYLTMTHDPRLHLPASGLPRRTNPTSSTPPSSSSSSSPFCRPTTTSWTDPALRRSEGDFLEKMRPQLNAYLQALGQRPLGDAEWLVYRDAALEEWEAGQSEREERVEAAGQSGFFNPRADEVYLQQLLEEGIPIGDPLGPQSRRYLDTLLRNPSWNFAQRRQAVQRLIQLNSHFARQPLPLRAPEGGSPFAPLFTVGGPDDVAPRLGPLEGGGQATRGGGGGLVPRPKRALLGRGRGDGGGGGRGGAVSEPLRLPKGF